MTTHETIQPVVTTDHSARFRARAAQFIEVSRGAAGRWAAPSPCEGWTAAQVVEHVLDTQRDFLGQRGLPLPDVRLDLADPLPAVEHQLAHVQALVDDPEVAATSYDSHFGPTTIADTLTDFYGWDLAVHGWDISRATGQPYDLDEDEVARLDRTADGWGDALHMSGICGTPVTVADDASSQDRLLGRLGRDPRWAA